MQRGAEWANDLALQFGQAQYGQKIVGLHYPDEL